jgi:alpha-L-fucosidase
LQYFANGEWKKIPVEQKNTSGRVKIFRFDRVWAERLKLEITPGKEQVVIQEVGVYNERK